MVKLLFILVCVLSLGAPFVSAGAKGMSAQDTKPIREAFDALYRFHFDKAHRAVDRFIAVHPDDPLGYSVRSSIALFQELDRLALLEGEFFKDDERIKDSKRLKPDPAIRRMLFDNIAKSQALAEARLAKDASDANALFCLTVTEGLRMDYLALVDKKHASSLKHARQSQAYAVRLLRVDPEFYDVYCTTGFSEYLLGSLPFFMRWFIKFEDTEGSKEEGLRKLQIAATKGDLFKPFAKLLLAIFFLRQKQPEMSERYLAQYEALYPENPLVRKERKKLMELIASSQASQQMGK